MIIKDVMTRNPICVEVDTSIVKAKEILNKNNFSKLPVVDKQKKLVGIITKNDIKKSFFDIISSLLPLKKKGKHSNY